MSANGKISRQATQPSFAHLRRLTDDTGLLEHALGRIPRRREGYTTDDNARAMDGYGVALLGRGSTPA